MSKLSFVEPITSKDEDYYVNLCYSGNKIKTVYSSHSMYHFSDFHKVEDKVVELVQHGVAAGWDDIDYELDEVIISDNLPY